MANFHYLQPPPPAPPMGPRPIPAPSSTRSPVRSSARRQYMSQPAAQRLLGATEGPQAPDAPCPYATIYAAFDVTDPDTCAARGARPFLARLHARYESHRAVTLANLGGRRPPLAYLQVFHQRLLDMLV